MMQQCGCVQLSDRVVHPLCSHACSAQRASPVADAKDVLLPVHLHTTRLTATVRAHLLRGSKTGCSRCTCSSQIFT